MHAAISCWGSVSTYLRHLTRTAHYKGVDTGDMISTSVFTEQAAQQ